MADPFSIFVGAVGCIEAAHRVSGKAQKIAKHFVEAKSIVADIVETISGGKTLLSAIRDALSDADEVEYVPKMYQPAMRSLLNKATGILLELEEILEYGMLKSDSKCDDLKVSRTSTAHKYSAAETLRVLFKATIAEMESLWQEVERYEPEDPFHFLIINHD